MANVLGELFQDIADAIRSKTGSTDTLKPNQFPEAIEGITTGGGGSSGDSRVKYVTFMYGETELIKYPVISGDTCRDPVANGFISTPTKESTAQYNYTFYGWGASDGGAADANILKNITEDKTVYVIFAATARMYTITWLDEDGTELPGQKQWAYGTVPSYIPTKEGLAFDKWTPTPKAVTGDASYTASWSSVIDAGVLNTGLAWRLAADGKLTISGSGAIPEYTSTTYTQRPWNAYDAQITAVVIDDGVTNVGACAFYKHTAVESVTLGADVMSIGNNAFNIGSLLRYSVSANNSAFYTDDSGALYNKDKTELIAFPRGLAISDYAVLNGCVSVARMAFNQCNVKNVALPDTVTTIANMAFYYHTSLENVSIGNGVITIGDEAFQNCTALLSCTIPDSVESLGSSVFEGCTALTDVVIGNGVKELQTRTFYNCTSLTQLTIGNSVTSIGSSAFYKCYGLRSITIPDSVTSIGNYAFESCSNLQSITIGNGVTSIGSSAFRGLAISSITIPGSVTSIGKSAFYSCSNLTSVTFKNTSGWYVTKTEGASSGTNVTVTSTSTAATHLKTTYRDYYWYRT